MERRLQVGSPEDRSLASESLCIGCHKHISISFYNDIIVFGKDLFPNLFIGSWHCYFYRWKSQQTLFALVNASNRTISSISTSGS